MHIRRDVWIRGLGAVSCAGFGTEPLWRSLALSEENARESFRDGLRPISEQTIQLLQSNFPEAAQTARPSLMAYAAARQAMEQAEWDALGPQDGLIVGTTAGEIPVWENPLIEYRLGRASAADCAAALKHQPLGSVAETLSKLLGFKGLSLVTSSACSASAQAIALGALWVKQGIVRRCLVGGTEALARLTVEGFKSLQLLSPEPSRPFDRERKGINLSEGAAFICLEAEAGDKPLARVSGFGLSTDAYHLTAPHPEGKGILQAMSAALAQAGLTASDIDWVHAHGTGSQANDISESAAIRQLFGSRLPQEAPWTSSTKGAHGHALGAAGALETVISVLALQKGVVPPTAGLRDPDPALALRHPPGPVRVELKHALKTTLGFGGNNAALVLSHPGGPS